jgi:hypothetical protein
VRRFAPQLSAQLFCISLVLFSVSNSQGQMPRRLTAQQQIHNREWALENLRRQARLQPNARERRVDQVSLRNDFRQLQLANNQLMARVFESPASQRITNKEIRSSLGEIRKLAERLRSSLGLPKIEPAAETDVALIPGLKQLDQALMSFVENPLFQQPRVYDTEMASRAAGDLNDVVRLADVLRKLTKDDQGK